MTKSASQKVEFTIEDKQVTVFPAHTLHAPVIYLNTFTKTIEDDLWLYLSKQQCPDFSLVSIGNLDWDHDMAPWAIPPISKDDTPCTPGADEYLTLLQTQIIPRAESHIKGTPVWRGLAGYSLAGLFAVYASFRTTQFSRIASMSGSLWFPGFKEYVFEHTWERKPSCLYLSLGSKEAKISNPFLRVVRQNTEDIEAYLKEQHIPTTFVLNPGNHFVNALERTAAGIQWILNYQS